MSIRSLVVLAAALAVAACGFSPTDPFEGFDGKGTRVHGSFDGSVATADGPTAAAVNVQGLSVYVAERPSLAVAVSGDGRFTLAGLPSGAWTLVFTRDGQVVGQIRFSSVRRNQGITIVVSLTTSGEVVLVQETRDQVSFAGAGECPRGAGFWCQNKDGQNPNLSAEEFRAFSTEAATLLAGADGLASAGDVADAVCQTGDQLRRQLATLALNIAAGTIEKEDALVNEPGYGTVGDALAAGVKALDSGTQERNAVKDVIERINENENTTGCEDAEDDDDADGDDDGVPTSGRMTICHIPPGNPNAKHTIVIDASAWPAHKAHGDKDGGC